MGNVAIPEGWAVYGALILFILGIATTANPKVLKIFGEWGKAAEERLERQRSTAKAADDADIAERDRQIAYLQGRADEQNAEIARRDALIREHLIWDYDMYDRVVRSGHTVPHPPPLFPRAPGTQDQEAP